MDVDNLEQVKSVVLLDVTNQTQTIASDPRVNAAFKGLQLVTHISKAPGGDAISVTLFARDPIEGGGRPLATSVNRAGVSTYVDTFYPGIEPGLESFSILLPREWFIVVSHNGTGAFDYTVHATLYR